MLGDEVDRHIGVKPGEVGLELPETWSFAELVRLFGEEAFLVRNEHARPQPLEGRETMGETISGRHGRTNGRAPCRERVCKTESISVAAAYLTYNPPTSLASHHFFSHSITSTHFLS